MLSNCFVQFQTTFVADYYFQEEQQFKVEVYDADDKKHIEDLSKHDYIGSAKFTLAKVVTGKMLTKPLTNKGIPRSYIYIAITKLMK